MSNGRSGIRITSAPPASPDHSAIQPAWRPITSTIRLRWCDSAVVCSRSIASVATCTAVSKPNVMSVAPMSLSIVFGTPSTGSPRVVAASWPRRACPRRRSRSARRGAATPCTSATRVGAARRPSAGSCATSPRIVPPRGRIPRTDSIVSSSYCDSIGPRQPSRKPTIAWPYSSMPLRTTARMTALRPGQSPPPVRTPMRKVGARYRQRPHAAAPTIGPRCAELAVLLLGALLAAGCGGGDDDRPQVPGDGALTIYTSLPRHGDSRGRRDGRRSTASGSRSRTATGGPAGARSSSSQLDSSKPDGQTWDPELVEKNAERAADDRAAIAYLGELDLGGSAISVPVTNDEGILQISPLDGLTSLTRDAARRPARRPRALLPERQAHVRAARADRPRRRRPRWSTGRASAAPRRIAIVHDDQLSRPRASPPRPCSSPTRASSRSRPSRRSRPATSPEDYADDARRRSPRRRSAPTPSSTPASPPRPPRRCSRAIERALPGAELYAAGIPPERRRSSGVAARAAGQRDAARARVPAPRARSVLDRIARAGRRVPPVEALYGYESMRLVLEAIDRAGPRAGDRAAVVREALRARAARRRARADLEHHRAPATSPTSASPPTAATAPSSRYEGLRTRARRPAAAPGDRARDATRSAAARLRARARRRGAVGAQRQPVVYLLDDGVDARAAVRAALGRLVPDPAASRSRSSAGRSCASSARDVPLLRVPRHRRASRSSTSPTSWRSTTSASGPALTIQYLAPLLVLLWLTARPRPAHAAVAVGRARAVGRRLLPRRARVRHRRARRRSASPLALVVARSRSRST